MFAAGFPRAIPDNDVVDVEPIDAAGDGGRGETLDGSATIHGDDHNVADRRTAFVVHHGVAHEGFSRRVDGDNLETFSDALRHSKEVNAPNAVEFFQTDFLPLSVISGRGEVREDRDFRVFFVEVDQGSSCPQLFLYHGRGGHAGRGVDTTDASQKKDDDFEHGQYP